MTDVYKVITAGEGGVGKTTLLHRYVTGKFDSNTLMTMGVDFLSKQIELKNNQVMLQLWDFGGQEQFRFMLEKYVIGAKGALLLFDLTRYSTLMALDNWITLFKKGDPDMIIYLIGAKLDLTEKISVDDDAALEIKEKYDLYDYIKVSSKTGENVEKIFKLLAEKLLEKFKY